MAGLEASHSAKFASACEFHLDEYLDEVAKEDDDRRELCDGEERNDEIRHEKCLVFLVATNMLLTLPIVETRGFSVLRGLPSGTDIVL